VTRAPEVRSASYSPDGRYIATAITNSHYAYAFNGNAALRLWDGTTGEPVGDPIPHNTAVREVKFSRDSRRVATLAGFVHAGRGYGSRMVGSKTDGGPQVCVWEVPSGRPCGPAIRRDADTADFSPNGDRIVIGGKDQVARVWDVESGQPVTPPMQHRKPVLHVEFSPDGRLILTTCGSHSLVSEGSASGRLWDAATGQPVTPPLRHSDPLRTVDGGAFSPEGSMLATHSRDCTTRIWAVASEGSPIDDLRRLAQVLSGTQKDAVGGLSPLNTEDKLAAWMDLRNRYPKGFAASPRQVRAWQHSEAVGCMKSTSVNSWTCCRRKTSVFVSVASGPRAQSRIGR
jgi:WD40 repeat protein